jgi:sn-glycerol 3-phosphate transport system permease protein
MRENSIAHRILPHVFLLAVVLVVVFPIWLVFAASTQTLADVLDAPMPLTPGRHLLQNYSRAMLEGTKNLGASALTMVKNSTIMALGISVGKIAVSLLAAFAIVYFRFPLRDFCFWTIFVTLMLPVEVRIMPTYKVISDLGMLDTYSGLVMPMIVSATAVFLFRQFFMQVPREMAEASQIDGAAPMQFFARVLVPMSRTPIAALFVIQFIYGWNQYLWPLLITTKREYYTLLIGINRMLAVGDALVEWPVVMATTLLAMLPPVVVVVVMQKQFIAGMTETEK